MESNFVEINHVQNNEIKKLSFWTFMIVSLRSYFLQSAFNYGNFQGIGYGYVIYPALKKMYGKTKKLQEALRSNIDFFNSNPQTLPFITSIHLVLLSDGQSTKNVNMIKMSLMGPLSGIGDSLTQYAIYPIFSVIASGFAEQGDLMGPLFFIIGMNIVLMTIKLSLGILGYRLGEKAIDKIHLHMQKIIQIAAMVGILVIVALALRMTKVTLGIEYSSTITGIDGKPVEKIVSINEMFQNILPYLLPAIWLVFVYKMITKYNWNALKVIGLSLVLGLTLGVFGILVP